ncbi:unnamed protein product, partial [Symbiodinium necroappetens]
TSLLSAVLQASPCPTVGEMEEEVEGVDGEKLSARDCAAVGEGFLDQLSPLCILPCGQDEEGAEVTVHCVVVGDIKGKLLICLPSASWHRTVARRTIPKGFLSRVFAAEVAAVSLVDRSVEVPGQTLRVWLGFCELEAEALLEVSDASPSVPFGALPSGELLVPSIDVLAEIWQAQQVVPPPTPLHTASEGGGQPPDVSERIASIERSVAALTAAFRDASLGTGVSAAANAGSKPKVALAPPKTFFGGVAKQRGAEAEFPGLDQGVVAAALAAGVQHGALVEMSKLVSAGPLARLKPEASGAAAKQATQTALEESEEEGQEVLPFPAQAAGSTDPQQTDPAEMFAKAVVNCFDAYHGKTVSGKTALDKALEAGAGGSLDGSLSSGRRHATARRALREALTSAPQELSALIEGLMAEDLCASTPGAGAPVLTSTRAWLEHRSRIQAFPTMVNLVWAIGGALDCLRANKVDQARARLNIALMQADQVSIDRGSWLLAQELSLEVGPPMTSFKRHEAVSSHGDPVYSRLLDARWAEVAIAKLREEAEFMERRQKLGQRLQPNLKDESAGETAEKPPRTPGSEAPGLSLFSLWNSMPRTLLRSSGPFASFFRSALQRESNATPTPYTWPCPMPFPEAFAADGLGFWKKRLINISVARLSYEHLGRNLQHLVFGSFFPLKFQPEDYGRIGHKVEGQAQTLEALGRAAASVCRSFDGYLPRSVTVAGPSTLGPSPVESIGTLPGKPDIAAMPITADRVKLPASPAFCASPFMDSDTAEFFNRPLEFARSPDPASERPPFVKILANKREKLLLLRALARSGRLVPLDQVPPERAAWGAGLFAVAKDSLRDRLVLDARPANQLESFPGHWVYSLASAACVGGIVLRPHEVLIMCGTDLQDCFYQFKASAQRTVRNHLACELSVQDAAFVFDRPEASFGFASAVVHCGLSSLAMGDSSACEFAQCSHLGVLLQARAVCMGELLVQAASPPRGLLSVGLVIDDLIIMQKLLASQVSDLEGPLQQTQASLRLDSALAGYDAAHLRYSEKKTFRDRLQASFWGVDCCGRSGLVRANPARYWPLVLITVRVLQLGLATRALLESLIGSWVSVFMLRRRLLCLVDLSFQALRGGTPQTILRLSPELKGELASFVCLGHLAVVDLRAQPLDSIIATDASSAWQAAVSAPVSSEVVAEFQRHAVQRGAWSKLLPPPAAWLKEHNLLEPESELPGDTVFTAHPVAEAAARVPVFEVRWRREHKRRMHINVAELEAYLHEESRLAGRVLSGRPLFGLDSQVCIGALAKGRSASPVLNRKLRASLAPLLCSRLFPHYLFFPTDLNPADDPTRARAVRAPSLQKPSWWTSLEEGDTAPFDEFLRSAGVPADESNGFKQDDLLSLGGVRPAVLKSNRERGLSSAVARLPRHRVPGSSSVPVCFESCGCGLSSGVASLPQAWTSVLERFPLRQFLCRRRCPLDLSRPGVLHLFAGADSVARALLRAGAPWVLTFDPQRDPREDLAQSALRQQLQLLMLAGAFLVVGGSPPGSTFSRAVRPPVRSRSRPLGLCDISPRLRAKVLADNERAEWILHLRDLCRQLGIAYWFSQPDTSFFWLVPGWEDEAFPASPHTFRADLCLFGCLWRKRTRVALNTSLAGARLLCQAKVRHLRLVGRSSAERLPWTSLAQTVPAGFADAVALAACVAARWTSARALGPSSCAKLGCSCRVGEAKNPGPRRRSTRPVGDLESRPLQSQTSLFLGDSAWRAFLSWVSGRLSVDPVSLFVACPILAAMALRAYGNHLFSSGGTKHTFRYTLVGAQRALLVLKGSLGPAWELLTRWEAVEPTIHRTPVPEPLLMAMVSVGWLRGFRRWCGCALLAFYGTARIGEVLACQRRHLVLPEDLFKHSSSLFLRLDSSKTSLRGRPRVQHVRVDDPEALALVRLAFAGLEPGEKLFPLSHAAFRTRWDRCLAALGLGAGVSVTPGGLRGGGAVACYHKGTPIADIQWRLRLKNMATLEHYLQEVAALTALSEASSDAKSNIQHAVQLFPFLVATG